MRWFTRLSIEFRLTMLFGVLLVVMAAAGVWTAMQVQTQDDAFVKLMYGTSDEALLVQRMRSTFLLQVQSMKDSLIRGDDPQAFNKYAADFDTNTNDLRELRARVDSSSLTSAEQQLLKQFDDGWVVYRQSYTQAKVAYGGPGGGKIKAADAVMAGKDRAAVGALDALSIQLTTRSETESAQLAASGARSSGLILPLFGVIIVLGLITAWYIIHRLSRENRLARGRKHETAPLGEVPLSVGQQ